MMCKLSSSVFILHFLTVTAAIAVRANEPIRIDLSAATRRSDAETLAWHEWEIEKTKEASNEFNSVTVTLRPAEGDIEGFLYKAGLATGATIASDGVTCPNSLEVVLEGLKAGKHTIVTYHNRVSNESPGAVKTSIGNVESTITTTRHASDDDDVATNYLEFEVTDGTPVVIEMEALDAENEDPSVVLNGLEIDGNDPRRKAIKPSPSDLDNHAKGESGRIELAWQAPDSAKRFRVYLSQNRDWNRAVADVRSATIDSSAFLEETAEQHFTIPVDPVDSLQYYCWRVDALDAEGNLTRGDVWSFRVRHLAFPGAEGYGRFAIGGRGGKVLKVTNLNDSGPGSLRAALETSGPRTIVFDVSGRIHLKSTLAIRDDYVTIAGQTAPGKGICISNYNLGMLGAHDNVIRFLRVRPGDTSGETLDGMGMASSDHSIIDHCSISWTHDEAFSSRGAKNITLQRTLISEALNVAGHRKYKPGTQHGYAASISGDIGSFHHNLLAHCAGRNWSLAGGIDQANVHAGRLDIRNNVVYNWGYRTTDGGAKQVVFVNNYYKPGPATTVFHVLKPERNHAFGPQDYHVRGNVMEGRYGGDDALAGVIEPRDEPLSAFLYDKPFFTSYVHTQSARDAFEDVLADVGCSVPMRDDHDERILREAREGTTTYKGSRSGLPGLPDSQEDVGGWEDYPEIHRLEGWDTDGDGMPNHWERAHDLDPDNAADGAKDSNGDGYTNLEEYLNELALAPSR